MNGPVSGVVLVVVLVGDQIALEVGHLADDRQAALAQVVAASRAWQPTTSQIE
jgi:hypothetical protein